jgi:hypothetical protein
MLTRRIISDAEAMVDEAIALGDEIRPLLAAADPDARAFVLVGLVADWLLYHPQAERRDMRAVFELALDEMLRAARAALASRALH